jgi:hypothetical protein
MHAGNVVSLVKRTLFEANSKARRLGKADLTSVQTSRLLLATSQTVKPATPEITFASVLGCPARDACNILASFCICEEESDRLPTVAWHGFVQKGAKCSFGAAKGRNQSLQDPLNDNDEPRPVMIITGRVWKKKNGKPEGVHVMLMAPDDDSAVRRALESLAAEGYAEAELDQIGEMQEEPDEEPHLSAYQGALEGEVSIVTFDEPI